MVEEMYKLEASREFPAKGMGHALRQLGNYFIAASHNPKVATNLDGIFDVGCVRVGRVEDFQDIDKANCEELLVSGVIEDFHVQDKLNNIKTKEDFQDADNNDQS